MLYTVNVEVMLRRDDSWLLIVRSPNARHAAGKLAGVGGHLEIDDPSGGVLEGSACREVAEEVGLDLTDVPLSYVDSVYFVGDTGNQVLNVLFTAELPATVAPTVAAPEEVAAIAWRTLPELEADTSCPPWTLEYVRRALACLPHAARSHHPCG